MGFGKFVRTGSFAVVVGCLTLFAACSGDEHLGPVPIQKSTIRISPSTIDLEALADLGEFTATRTDGQGRPSNLDRFLWRSLSPDIAQIDGAGRVVSLGSGTATIEVSVNGETATAEVVVDQVPVTLSVGPAAYELNTVDQELDLKLDARDRNGFRIPRETFAWESDDADVVTVTTAGRMRSRREGRTRVRVRKKRREESTEVTVTSVASAILIQPKLDTLKAIGGTIALRAYQTDGSGRVVEDHGFQWTSSQTSIATVATSGQEAIITARNSGVVDIRAAMGSMEGFARVVILPSVEAVSVAPAVVALGAPGQTLQLSASGTDSNGGAVSNSAFSWASNRPSVATVNGSGLVTGVGSGTAQIVATAPSGAKGFATVGVGQIRLNVAPKLDTLKNVGDQTSLAIYPTDANGGQASCPSPTWKSLNTSVATVNSVGRVVAVGLGSAAIVVSGCAVQETASILVTGPGGGGGGGGSAPPPSPSTFAAPALPRSLPQLPSGYTNVVRLAAGGNLQSAINSAPANTEILLAPGATFNGALTIAGGAGCLRIATDLPSAPQSRVDTLANLATITAGAGNKTIAISRNCVELDLLEVTNEQAKVTTLVSIQGATAADQPDRILVDRSWLHARGGKSVRRGVQANGSNITVRRSQITDMRDGTNQAQGVAQWNAIGPLLVEDNYMRYQSQGFMCGGAGGVRYHPADITIRRNHIYSPPAWFVPGVHLAGVETKDCHRILIEANVIEGGEFGILNKSAAQGGACGQATIAGSPALVACGTDNTTVRWNIIHNTRNGINIPAVSGGGTQVRNHDALYQDNLIYDIGPDSKGWPGGAGKSLQILGAPDRLAISGLTIRSRTQNWINFGNTPPSSNGSLFLDNIKVDGVSTFLDTLSPSGFSNYYGVSALGNVYGGCFKANRAPKIPITCTANIPNGVGADEARIAQATSGVRN